MRIVEFVDGASSETTPVIGNIVASDLVTYPDDATYEATELGAPAAGNLYFNTTDNVIRYYNGSTWQELIDENTTQALENKAIDADQNMITNIDNNEIKPGAAIDVTKLHNGAVDNTEFGYLDGVTSAIQTQLNDKIDNSEKGAINGVASLDGAGKIPSSQIPPVALSETAVVADNVARDALTVQEGDTANTTDSGKWWIYDGASWLELTTPANVTSVNGQSGAVSLATDDLSDVSTTGVNDGEVLIYNSGSWAPGVVAGGIDSVRTETSAYTVQTSDDLIFANANGAGFTLTLYSASANAGRMIKIKKTDNTFNVVTIDGNGAETIDGNLTTTLNTRGETIRIVSDGTNWEVLDRYVPQGFTSYIPTTQGFGTISIDTATWSRSGKYIEINVRAQAGIAAATEAQWGLPTGITIESGITGPIIVGRCSDNTSPIEPISILATENDTFLNFANSTASTSSKLAPGTGSDSFVDSTFFSFFARIPIEEWNG